MGQNKLPKWAKFSCQTQEIDNVDRIARYGSGGVWLTRLLRASGHAYSQAGGLTVTDVLLDIYTTAS